MAGADVVVTDTWISMGQDHAAEKLAAMAPYQVTEALLAEAGKALEPFAEFAHRNTDEDGWSGTRCEGERIRDWFGPSEFRLARSTLSKIGDRT